MKRNLTSALKPIIIIFIVSMVPIQLLSQKSVDYRPPPEWAWAIEDSMEYFIYTPGNLEIGKRYPIALYLHGCCGDSPHAITHRTVDPPVRIWHNFGENTQDIPTYIVSPQTTRGWSQHFASIRKVIDFLVEKRQGDPQRIYIFGFSMGGRGLYELISEYPDYFAAAMPLGMSFFNGDFEKIKDIPIWANQGELDRWAREMPKFVKETRALNGLVLDSAYEWVTGVNPRYTSFEGLGHNVQWETATTQDITGWAYSKVNDGNKYPIVFFESPHYREEVKEGKSFKVKINANDPDGTIDKIVLYLNQKYHSTILKAPYELKIDPVSGDNLLEAVAFDDKGKTNTATTTIVVDRDPGINLEILPYARAGAYYKYVLSGFGNGMLIYTGSDFPEGLHLLKDGLIRGIPKVSGKFYPRITLRDEDGDEFIASLSLEVKERRAGEVMISNAKDPDENELEVSKMVFGETANFNRDEEPSSMISVFSFSDLTDYYGLTFVKSEANDSTSEVKPYMSFDVDKDVNVFVAYEKFDHVQQSTVPVWLSDFRHIPNTEITAQLRYYDIYSKRFPKGKVSLPGSGKNIHGIRTNYFVMVKADDFDNHPEINIENLPIGFQNTYYDECLTSLYGHGRLKWKLIDGLLPAGLKLSEDGKIDGVVTSKGSYSFDVKVTDEKGQMSHSQVKMEIK